MSHHRHRESCRRAAIIFSKVTRGVVISSVVIDINFKFRVPTSYFVEHDTSSTIRMPFVPFQSPSPLAGREVDQSGENIDEGNRFDFDTGQTL